MRSGFFDNFFYGVDNLLQGLNLWFAKPLSTFCALDTVNDSDCIVTTDGSLITVLEAKGSLQIIGAEEFTGMINRLEGGLRSRFADTGHILQVVMRYDPMEVADEIKDALVPSRRTAKQFGMAVDVIFDDFEEVISRYCATEHVFFVLWTRPFVLPPAQRKTAIKKMGENIKTSPVGRGQTVGKQVDAIVDKHHGYVSQVASSLSDAGILNDRLDAHTALWWVRHEIDATFTSRKWRVLLPGDRPARRLPEKGQKQDPSYFFYPALADQLFPREGETIDRRTIRIGDTIHAPLQVVMPPQNPKPFNLLYKKLMASQMPWRCSFYLDGDGLAALGFRGLLASVWGFSSSVNRRLKKALDELRVREENGEAMVRLKINLDTWVDVRAFADINTALAQLRRQADEVASAVQGWGTADAGEVTGDPLLGTAATVPALLPNSPAPNTAAPLWESVQLLPVTRPANVWKTGSILLRSPDGKLMPYTQGSSKQSAWIDVGFAPMGGGKSVWLNTMNWGFLTQPGLMQLPYLSVVDVGPSSSGLIQLVQSVLPKDQQHLATYQRLQNDEAYAINPFDTLLGCRWPVTRHMSFLINLLALFATPLDADSPQDGVPGIARAAVSAAYEEFSDKYSPKPYTPHIDEVVDAKIQEYGMDIDRGTTWWNVVDFLFDHGCIHEAKLAQRYAVPLLSDVANMTKREMVTSLYTHETPSGEPIADFFWRACLEAIDAYPILGRPTKFSLDDAKVISLDLDEVAPRGGPEADRQTGVMYMLARHVVGNRFFQMMEDIENMPARYQEYHRQSITSIRQDPKRLCYDELHRVARNSSISKQLVGDLETSARESRKWNLHIGLYSQSIEDIPDIILELATSIFILGAGTTKSVQDLQARLGLSDAAARAIRNLTKPGPAGAPMVAQFRTEDGIVVQQLVNTIGTKSLWAFSSTAEDIALRNRLYSALGVELTLKVLSERYPGGIKKVVEQRRAEINDDEAFETDQVDVIQQMADAIIRDVRGGQ